MDYNEFEAMLRSDEEKASQYKSALESAKDNGAKGDIEAMAMAAAAVGVEFTPEQIEQHIASCAEISDEDLDQVSGGHFLGNNCWAVYYCFAGILHSDEQLKSQPCWSDYNCVTINK